MGGAANTGYWIETAAPVLVAAALAYAFAFGLSRRRFALDHPNARSNHSQATPRSGGLALIIALLAALAAGAFSGVLAPGLALNLAAATFFAFAIGFADDMLSLPPLWKFAGQFLAAGLFIVMFGPLDAGPAPFIGQTGLGAAGALLTVFWIVGFMNAYNFMDGVNGIAASCGAFALAGLAAAAALFGAGDIAVAALAGGAALVGFLPLNFPRARLFMGDGGSQAIGFLVAATALLAASETGGQASALFAPVAMAPFLFDVAFTLAHRLARRRNVLSAHSEHLYQIFTRIEGSHVKTTAAYLALTAFSTAAALAMLRLHSAWQFLVPLALCGLFIFPALALFRRARRAGLLEDADTDLLDEAGDSDLAPAYPHAAE